MVYGNQLEIRQFLTAVAQGFVQTRLDMLLLFLFLLGLVVAFAAYLATQKRAVREAMRATRERLQRLLANLDLSQRENALLESLAGLLEGKGREADSKEYALMQSRHLFDSSARKALQAGIAAEVELNALRMKIGFRPARLEEAPASSAELPEGLPILLQGKAVRRLRATVIAQGPSSLVVRLDPKAGPPFGKGAGVTASFFNAAGVYSFSTWVRERSRDILHLEHSSSISRLQRRRFYRRKERFPVIVKAASRNAPGRESALLDLGAGGASLENPLESIREGDLLEITFSPRIEKLALAARVIRVSEDRTIIHVKFESPTESERDRIMRFLFRPSGAAA